MTMSQMTLPNSMPVTFLLPDSDSGNTQWRWKKGPGELRMEGGRLILSGRRLRPFMFASPQTITVECTQLVDVTRDGARLFASVIVESGKNEPLQLEFSSEQTAREVAVRLPKNRSATTLEQEALDQALARAEVQVWVTPAMAAVCVLVFIAMAIDGVPVARPTGPELIPWGTNFGPRTLDGEPWRLYTAVFLHFGIQHLFLNMISLISLGPMTERLLGNVRFLVMYVVAGLCGSMASLWWNPGVNSAGASGAIFGVIGALLAIMFHPHSGVPPGIARRSRNSALAFLGVNLLNGLRPGIDMAAHLGGLGAGVLLGWLFVSPLPKPDEPPARASAVPGLVAAVLLVTLLAGRAFNHSEEVLGRLKFRDSLQTYVAAASAAESRVAELRVLIRDTPDSRREWAKRTLAEAVPLWDGALDAAMLLPRGPTRKELELADLLRQYATSRILELELFAEGILEDDSDKIRYGNEVHQAEEVRRKLAEMMIEDL